jgi:hypothetical protein
MFSARDILFINDDGIVDRFLVLIKYIIKSVLKVLDEKKTLKESYQLTIIVNVLETKTVLGIG